MSKEKRSGYLTCGKCGARCVVGRDLRFYCSDNQCRLHEQNIDIPALDWFKIEDEMLHGTN